MSKGIRWTEEEWARHDAKRLVELPVRETILRRDGRPLTIPGGRISDTIVPDPPKPKKKRKDEEHNEQVVFFNRIRTLALNDKRYAKAVDRTFAIPNGGGRSKAQAGRLKAEGVRAGVVDIECSYPVGEFHGLYIEMKSLTGSPSRDQAKFIADSLELGYMAACCRGADAAFKLWNDYVDESL